MNKLYEMLGRKQAQLEDLDAEYTKVIGLLVRLRSGELLVADLAVDQTARSWSVMQPTVAPVSESTAAAA